MAEQHNHDLCPNTTVVKNLTAEVERLRDENVLLRDKAIEGEQRTIRIFEILSAIEESVKGINTTITTLMTRPDPFKTELQKLGLRVVELAIMGGIMYMALQGNLS